MNSLSLDISHVFAWNVCGLSLSILRCDFCLTNRFYLVILKKLTESISISRKTKLKSQSLTFKSFSTQYHTFSELRSFRLGVVSPTVSSPTSRVDSPTSNMSARLRLKLRTMTNIDSPTWFDLYLVWWISCRSSCVTFFQVPKHTQTKSRFLGNVKHNISTLKAALTVIYNHLAKFAFYVNNQNIHYKVQDDNKFLHNKLHIKTTNIPRSFIHCGTADRGSTKQQTNKQINFINI